MMTQQPPRKCAFSLMRVPHTIPRFYDGTSLFNFGVVPTSIQAKRTYGSDASTLDVVFPPGWTIRKNPENKECTDYFDTRGIKRLVWFKDPRCPVQLVVDETKHIEAQKQKAELLRIRRRKNAVIRKCLLLKTSVSTEYQCGTFVVAIAGDSEEETKLLQSIEIYIHEEYVVHLNHIQSRKTRRCEIVANTSIINVDDDHLDINKCRAFPLEPYNMDKARMCALLGGLITTKKSQQKCTLHPISTSPLFDIHVLLVMMRFWNEQTLKKKHKKRKRMRKYSFH